jgi:DegV family protein with EDD domain
MSEYIISCCTPADIPVSYYEKYDIKPIFFHYILDGKEYNDDLEKTMSLDEFYQKLKDGSDSKTAQVGTGEYIDAWEPYLKEGKDVLHITLGSGISGTFNSANTAKDMLADKYPDRKILLIDSLAGAAGYGVQPVKAAILRNQGMSIEENYKWLKENVLKACHWFYTTDLTFLIKGGRVSKTAGVFGKMLNICPLMRVDNDGKIEVVTKARGRKKAMETALEKVRASITDPKEYDDVMIVNHSAMLDEAKLLVSKLEEEYPKMKGKIGIQSFGTTIGSHLGPGTVGVFYYGNFR